MSTLKVRRNRDIITTRYVFRRLRKGNAGLGKLGMVTRKLGLGLGEVGGNQKLGIGQVGG